MREIIMLMPCSLVTDLCFTINIMGVHCLPLKLFQHIVLGKSYILSHMILHVTNVFTSMLISSAMFLIGVCYIMLLLIK